MEFFSSLYKVIDRFDAFILDLWGVIHDGQELYEGAREGLEFLKSNYKTVILLSNAPRRAKIAAENLQKLGIQPLLYDHIVTSGEAVFDHFKTESFGKKYIYIGPEKDRGLLEGLKYQEVTDASKADFALVTGFDDDNSTLEEKLPQLQAALLARIPFICANPDKEIVRKDGTRALCAGVMADWYMQKGGAVYYFGKPYLQVYLMVQEFLQAIDKNRICAMGDGLETDIKGANNAGIFSILVTGGICAQALGVRYGERADIKVLEQFVKHSGIMPKATIPGLILV